MALFSAQRIHPMSTKTSTPSTSTPRPGTPPGKQAWLEIITFWIRHGIKTLRVDNPQTKPFPFWKWIIAEVQRDHPEVISLSAAFSSPKVMKLLAKLGSTQSYTYLTWRNHATRTTGLHAGALLLLVCRSLSAPTFFVNTQDILSKSLQT